MLRPLILLAFAAAVASQQDDPASNQLLAFKENTMGPIGQLTTAAGAPVDYKEATSALNTNLLSNEFLLDETLALGHERIPERCVFAAGTGAFGYFEVTHDITHICKAKLFSEVGKKTPVAARFSLGGSNLGSRDTVRTSRGAAFKFYTEEGNLDLIGLNSPMLGFKDPLLFAPLAHAFQRNPATHLPDLNMLWDYIVLHPESIFVFLYIFSDFGMPRSHRHMASFPIHTYQVYNADGENSFVRFHFLPVQGEQTFNLTEARAISAGDPDYYARDLYNSIANGECVSWYVKVQILSEKDRKNANMDIFDLTKILPLDKYPLHPVGVITLDKNPINFFAEIEQLAFCPGCLVPGIMGSPDKTFEIRHLSYKDTQMYRLGSNYKKIPVNCPINVQVHTYIRDGVSPVNENGRDGPNYSPNSFNGPVALEEKNRPLPIKINEKPPNNFKQANDFYSKTLTPKLRSSLIENLVEYLCPCTKFIKKRAVKWFTVINTDLGKRVAKGLLSKCPKVMPVPKTS